MIELIIAILGILGTVAAWYLSSHVVDAQKKKQEQAKRRHEQELANRATLEKWKADAKRRALEIEAQKKLLEVWRQKQH